MKNKNEKIEKSKKSKKQKKINNERENKNGIVCGHREIVCRAI